MRSVTARVTCCLAIILVVAPLGKRQQARRGLVIELRLLGPIGLTGAEGRELRGLLAQPRRLALLAYLGAETPRRMHRRDSLACLFWPELDQAHARAALRQALYVLRTEVGSGVVVSRGDEEVGLAFDLIACDVAAFDDAMAAGRFHDALERYRGDLLEGFFISGAPEFEEWLERARVRLRASAVCATESMIDRADAAGDLLSAVRWARQRTRLAPHDEAAVRRLMSLLDRAGDRTAAVDVYRELAKRLNEVYEVKPSTETEALLRTVRSPRAFERPNDVAAADSSDAPLAPAAIRSRSGHARRWRTPVLAAVATLLIIGVDSGGESRSDAAALHGAIRAIAVLPMAHERKDSTLGEAADGLVEALTTDIGGIKSLRVTARRATLSIAPDASLATITRHLNVNTVLESAMRRTGDNVEVDVALLDAPSGVQRWAERFEGSARNPMALEHRIARHLLTALNVSLTAAEQKTFQTPLTNNGEAYDLFVRGNYHLRRESRSEDSLAIALFERAVRLDPNFAAAYAFLGRAYGLRALQFAPEDTTAIERAVIAVDKALRLDVDLAEAHYARGMILWGPRNHFTVEYAVHEYRRALELNPNLDDAHHQLGVLYLHVGLLDKAVAELQKTLALDPGNRFAEHRIGVALVDQGRYEEGLRTLRAVPPSFNPALWYYHVTWALLYLNRDDEASRLINEYLLEHPEDRGGVVTSIRAILHAKRGDVLGAERDVSTAQSLGVGYVHFHHTEYNIASAYALLHRPHAAVLWLRRAADDGWPCYPSFAKDPNLNNVRGDPEFIALLAQLRAQWEHYLATL